MKSLILLSTLALLPAIGSSATIHVPDDYPTIQGAIDASVNGDVIIVRPGVYVENIDFVGKALVVKSERGAPVTAIDGNQAGSVVTFENEEGPDSILSGFTITNGSPQGANGGGVNCVGSSPRIGKNTITKNSVGSRGGGIYCTDGSPVIVDNVISKNTSERGGGGICCENCSPLIKNNIVSGNHTGPLGNGGGIYCSLSIATISNNIIIDNTSSDFGGGIFNSLSSPSIITNNTIVGNFSSFGGGGIRSESSTIVNTIFRSNTPNQISGSATVAYCNVQGGWPGTGNIDADPLFAGAGHDDYHLTWDSPCRHAGENSSVIEADDFEGDPRIVGGSVDMGADEFYYHLYHTGSVLPGNTIDVKIIGYPQAPVSLAWGQTILDPPISTQQGDLHIWPFVWSGFIGNVQSTGVLVRPVTIPSTWQSGDGAPLQALVGPWGGGWARLTNLDEVTVD